VKERGRYIVFRINKAQAEIIKRLKGLSPGSKLMKFGSDICILRCGHLQLPTLRKELAELGAQVLGVSGTIRRATRKFVGVTTGGRDRALKKEVGVNELNQMKRGIDFIPQTEFRPVVSKLVEILLGKIEKIRSIVLFGSIARGNASASTDLDLIVVSDAFPPNPSKAADRIIEAYQELKSTPEYRKFREQGGYLNIDPIGYRARDLERAPPLFLDVTEDGILLVDDGFMEGLLRELVKRMRRLGSRRVRTRRGWYWDLKPDYVFGEVVEI
jgi:hypothetical protein